MSDSDAPVPENPPAPVLPPPPPKAPAASTADTLPPPAPREVVGVFDQYFEAVRKSLRAIESTQLPAIREAAGRFAATIRKERLVHVFGTGHSRMAVEELFPRYGSFPGFHPIVELSMSFHNPVVGANGQRQAMFLENVQGFGPVLWRNFVVTAEDCLLAISSSGCNAVTIDVALEAKAKGMYVVALTSVASAEASTSKHSTGKKLHQVADLVLDHKAPPGDSAVRVPGLDTPVSPLSTITGCTIINLLKAEIARLLTAAGSPPKVLTAACHIGPDRARSLFEETYDDYRRRVGVLYR
ncbi:sugar isomerase domain-containing protein [Aquisphaera insulae]|uniref:sugar isomerase domain-containing protein n=1 Tax=Aquisphaera insulae TaxID=2712864 RepID=UPI0013EC0B26|nr:SIS domain-containing protein [Aquisphaera insulae]